VAKRDKAERNKRSMRQYAISDSMRHYAISQSMRHYAISDSMRHYAISDGKKDKQRLSKQRGLG
jgi:hypothetical protein